jgi:hypothetical protein
MTVGYHTSVCARLDGPRPCFELIEAAAAFIISVQSRLAGHEHHHCAGQAPTSWIMSKIDRTHRINMLFLEAKMKLFDNNITNKAFGF